MRVPFFPKDVISRNVPIYLMIFIRHTGANMVWVILPLFLQEVRGFDDLQLGIIYALNPFVQFAVMQRIDRYRSAPLVVVGLLASIATFILLTVAVDFLSILLTQVVLGFAWATLYVGSLKFIMETNPEVGTAGGLFNSVLSIASIVGPIMGGFLAALDFVVPMYAAAIFSAVALGVYAVQLHLIRPRRLSLGINRG
jgi:MFS family permease